VVITSVMEQSFRDYFMTPVPHRNSDGLAQAAAVIPRSGKGRQATKPNTRVKLRLTVRALKSRFHASSDVAVLHRPSVDVPPANSSTKSALPAALPPGWPARVPTVHRRHHKTAINGRSTEVEKWPPRRPPLAELPGRARRWIVHVMGEPMDSGGTVDWGKPWIGKSQVCPDPCFGVPRRPFAADLPGLSGTRV